MTGSGFGSGFNKIEVDSDSSGFVFNVSGFGFEMSGFAHHWSVTPAHAVPNGLRGLIFGIGMGLTRLFWAN